MPDANSTFNETYMQVTGLHITVLAASKHIGPVMVYFLSSILQGGDVYWWLH